VGVGALHIDEVDRAVADDAVGDMDVAAAGEPNVRHADRLARGVERVNADFAHGAPAVARYTARPEPT